MNDDRTRDGPAGRLRQNRWIWLAALGTALCLAGVHLTQRLMILPGFAKLERESAEKNLERCADAIAREVYHLDKICGDWSAWDNTYQFVQDKNQAFLDANMDWPTLEEKSGLNLIMFYSLTGERIWGEVFDSSQGGKIEIGELGAPSLGKGHILLDLPSEESKRTGFVLTRNGALLLSSRPILRTDGKGPYKAALIMGQFLNKQVLEELADQTKVAFEANCLQWAPLSAEKAHALARLASRPFIIDEASTDELHGFAVMNDLYGKPALLLSAAFPREVMRQGRATTRLAAWAAEAALALAVALIVLWHTLRLNESRRYASRVERLVDERTAQLREAQSFLETALAQSPSGILIADAPSGAVRLANPAALGLRSGGPPFLAGSGKGLDVLHWQAFRPDGTDYPSERLPLTRAVLLGEVTQEEELIIRDAEGIDHWISVNAAPIHDAEGRVTAGIVVFHDITVRKRAEEDIQKAQRLRSLGTLAGGIAHDFNNVLMALYGNISLAKEDLPCGHVATKPLEEAEKSMNRAVRLTRQLLTFARGGEPVKEDVSVGQVAEEVARFDLSGSTVSLTFDCPANLWQVEADKGQIQQVISNLTINAREAMPDGGHLYISLANEEVPTDAVPGLRPGRYVRITVRDDGIGIEPMYLNRIFDPYFTTKQTGSGLGLATTYAIVSRHGGRIDVESALGRGTAFTLLLPAAVAAQPPVPVDPLAGRQPPRRQGARILVLDDEEQVCKLVSTMLRKRGFVVETVADGRQAIERYREAFQSGVPFDALIMDLTIPGGLGGKEALREILAFDPDAKAVVSSGYAVDPVMAHYADYGFKGIAAKPYSARELLTVLDPLLARSGDDSE